jgi:hypothetical protein
VLKQSVFGKTVQQPLPKSSGKQLARIVEDSCLEFDATLAHHENIYLKCIYLTHIHDVLTSL